MSLSLLRSRCALSFCAATLVLALADTAFCQKRNFNVYLVNPRAQWEEGAHLPPDIRMLVDESDIEDYYFDFLKNGVSGPRVDSFAEWWWEVSYGIVKVDDTPNSHIFGWMDVPWPISPQNSINIPLTTCPGAGITRLVDDGAPMSFGRGELVFEGNNMILIDYAGDDGPPEGVRQPAPNPIVDFAFTPGERFMDLDADFRYDALHEYWVTYDVDGDCILNNPSDDNDVLGEDECRLREANAQPPEPCEVGSIPVVACDWDDYVDLNGNSIKDYMEPWEDFLVFRDRAGEFVPHPPNDPRYYYQEVPESYIIANYPGIIDALLRRKDNGVYDPPEEFRPSGQLGYVVGSGSFSNPNVPLRNLDESETPVQFGALQTPKPSWYEEFWHARYGSIANINGGTVDPPLWPVGGAIPNLIQFEPLAEPSPTLLNFQSNRGGLSGYGSNEEQEDQLNYVVFNGSPDCQVYNGMPAECVLNGCGYSSGMCSPPTLNWGDGSYDPLDPGAVLPTQDMNYCGPKEHDDLPSSIYHSRWAFDTNIGENIMLDYGGSKTFGEVTSSDHWTTQNRQPYGQDRSAAPFGTSPSPDGIILPGGPLAGGAVWFPEIDTTVYESPVPVYGAHGSDGGNVLTLEYLTWQRRSGSALARPRSQFVGNNVVGAPNGYAFPRFGYPHILPGFGDFDLDGLLDLGEGPNTGYDNGAYLGVENYGADEFFSDGVTGGYPYNRDRMLEDIMAFVDSSHNVTHLVDFEIGATGVTGISGIALLPGGTQSSQSCGVNDNVFAQLGGYNVGGVVCDTSGDSCVAGIPFIDLMQGPYAGTEPCPPSPPPLIGPQDCSLVPDVERLSGMYNGSSTGGSHIGVNSEAILLDRGQPGDVEAQTEGKYKTAYAARDYGFIWEGFVNLNDTDQQLREDPVGAWDIMAGDSLNNHLALVHTMSLHKQSSNWIEPINLASELTPGVPQTITVVGAEATNPTQSYFYFYNQNAGVVGNPLENVERFDFWYYTDTRSNEGDQPKFSNYLPWGDVQVDLGLGLGSLNRVADGCDEDPGNPPSASIPSGGLVVMRSDLSADPKGLPLQQRNAQNPTYLIVQADGEHDLEHPYSFVGTGNSGDSGDLFPGTCDVTTMNSLTDPNNQWVTPGTGNNGLEIVDVQNLGRHPTAGMGSARVTFLWQPQDTATLTFQDVGTTPSVGSTYPLSVRSFDLHGGTEIHLYVDQDEQGYDGSPLPFSPINKGETLGVKDVRGVLSVNIGTSPFVEDGEYRFYAFLEPGTGINGDELNVSPIRAAVTNIGDGPLTVNPTDVRLIPGDPTSARAESWTVRCVRQAGDERPLTGTIVPPGLEEFEVIGSLSGLQDRVAVTSQTFTTTNPAGAVVFSIARGTVDFERGDEFTFTTPGWTVYSEPITVLDGEFTPGPRAIIDVSAPDYGPNVGRRPLRVTFNGGLSTNAGASTTDLIYDWDFGDGNTGSGVEVTHTYVEAKTYTVSLTVTNALQQSHTVVEEDLIVVLSNAPTVIVETDPHPASGNLPLGVTFTVEADDLDGDPIAKYEFDWEFPCVSASSFNELDFVADSTTSNPVNQLEMFHQYTDVFNGCAGVRVTDSAGESTTVAVEINAGNQPPIAVAKVADRVITSGSVPETIVGFAPMIVDFDASASSDPDNDPLTYSWDFGDGSPIATAEAVTHTYDSIRQYTAVLTVEDSFGSSDSVSIHFDVRLGQANTITIGRIDASPDEGTSPLLVQFSASAVDEQGGELSYRWDFGDGSNFVYGRTVAHTFISDTESSETFEVTLLVSNDTGSQATGTINVTVLGALSEEEDPNLIAEFAVAEGSSATGMAPHSVSFTTTGSGSTDGRVATCTVDFGDGQVINVVCGIPIAHTYEVPGTYLATSTTVADDGKRLQSDAIEIVVSTSQLPSAVIVTTPSPPIGDAPLTIQLNGTQSSDPEGTALTYAWDFGDGTPGVSGATVNHVYSDPGTYTVQLTVTDQAGDQDSTTVEVVVEEVLINQGGDVLTNQDTPDDAAEEDGADLCGATGGCGATGFVSLLLLWFGMLRMRLVTSNPLSKKGL